MYIVTNCVLQMSIIILWYSSISTFVLLWQAKTAIAVDIIKDVDSNNCKIIIHVKNIVVLSIIGLSKAWHWFPWV